MFENIPFITRADKTDLVGRIEEVCGDEFAHGQTQVLRSFEALEARLSFDPDHKQKTPQCFVLKTKGFWATEHAAPSEEATIPVYVYALKEGASYKVAISSRFIPTYKTADYYTEVANGSSTEKIEGGILLRSSTYSSDLLSILRDRQKTVGVEVFEVL